MLQHRYWHFYDTAFSPDHSKLGKPDRINALTQIVLFTQAIKTSSDDSIRSYDLVWLLHMVGDVHQPLHATTRFDKPDPKGDQGGNLVHICSAAQMAGSKKCRSELHGFWDDTPGSNKGPETARTQASKLADAPASTAGVSDPAQWIQESFTIAKTSVYADPPIGIGDGPFVLTADYRAKARDIAHQRLALAGARLANLLNQNLKTSP
jgi:S1/P1 Nuclease